METGKLTRGQQYLRLLRIDYENLIRAALIEIDYSHYMIENYDYDEWELAKLYANRRANYQDIAYFTEALSKLGGAENEEPLTESRDSESPTDRFVGINCTTVL